MANDIYKNTERVRSLPEEGLHTTARAGLRQANVEMPHRKPKPDWSGFLKAGADLYSDYKKAVESRADQRSDQVIGELTPDERREAISQGLLLYQDDKAAMKALRRKVGQMDALKEDMLTSDLIKRGKIRTPEDLDNHMAERYRAALQTVADTVGVGSTDPDLLEGWNNNIVQRKVALAETLQQTESNRLETIAVTTATDEALRIFTSPEVMANPEMAQVAVRYMQASYDKGELPTPEAFTKTLKSSLSEVASKPNSTEALMAMRKSPIRMHGREMPLEAIIGPEQFDNLILKSENSTLEKQNFVGEELAGMASSIENLALSGKFGEAYVALDQMSAYVASTQPSDFTTAYKQQVNQMRATVARAETMELMETRSARDKELKISQEEFEFGRIMQARMAGQLISTDPKNHPEFQYPEEVEKRYYANKIQKINQAVESGVMDEATAASTIMRLVNMSHADSPARAAINDEIATANNQLNAAAVRSDDEINYDEDFNSLKKLKYMYEADPLSFTQLSPELAGTMNLISTLERLGVNGIEAVVHSTRDEMNQDEETKRLERTEWANNSRSTVYADLLQGDHALNEAAFTFYKSIKSSTRNPNQAADLALKMVRENIEEIRLNETEAVISDSGSSSSWRGSNRRHIAGMLPKTLIQLDKGNPNSVEAGRKAITEIADNTVKENVGLGRTGWTVQGLPQRDQVMVRHATGAAYFIDMSDLRENYRKQAQEASQKAHDKAVKELNKTREQNNTDFPDDFFKSTGSVFRQQ